jgi:23S rRNA (cytosine1962-C5)-methyltransferase
MFNIQFPEYLVKTIAVKLKPAIEKQLLQSKHPWIYSNSIEKIGKNGNTGDLAILFHQKTNKTVGVGLYDPHSPIRIKMLRYHSSLTVDKTFFLSTLQKAHSVRKPLIESSKTNSFRLIFGENDGLPACIIDIYNDVAVLKLYSAIWFPYVKEIVESTIKTVGCKSVVIRLSRQLQNLKNSFFNDGQVIYGTLENETVVFIEHGVLFSANVVKGHKTGYFLDHRENRRIVGTLANNKSVLDIFAYSGGFSVHALVGGAKEVTSVDVSEHALKMAKENVKLNSFSGKHNIIVGDAFEILENLHLNKQRFNIVVIDPPSFAKSEAEINLAIKKYRFLARIGSKLVSPNGYLIIASCSSRVTKEMFFDTIQEEINKSSDSFELVKQTQHDIDHPITYKEGAYLKCAYYKKTPIQ